MGKHAYSDYDEKSERNFYYCPFCRRREFDPFGCDHVIYFYDATNCQVSSIDGSLEKAIITVIKEEPEKWIEDYETEADRDDDDDIALEEDIGHIIHKYIKPNDLDNIITNSELNSVLPSFQIVEVADTDYRSYYMGNFYGIANKRDINKLKRLYK